MREILFRGKQVDNGEWVRGFLSQSRNIEEKPALLKLCIDYEEKGVMLSCIVNPETVGQYTGLTDKNGKLAFEGDLVKNEFNTMGVIRYGEYKQPFNDDKSTKHIGFYIDWLEESSEAYFRVDLGYWLPLVEIIGNIHDNPELLKKGD